ncbi:hypothetical protein DITRI_Ditri14bG0008500 [Diplodiscus trichospermus]
MRIRNSRPPFPLPSLPDPTSRFMHLPSRFMHLPSRNAPYFDDRFLVQETSRQIGWSCYPLKNPACQATEEGACGKLKKVITVEIRPIKFQDKKKGKIYCMQGKSSPVLGGQHEAQANEADEGIKPCVPTYYQEYGNASSSAVNFDLAEPFASSDQGGEVPFKNKKQTYQLETEITSNKKEDAIPEKKMELGNISLQDVEDENGSKSTGTIRCPTNCEYFIPPDNEGFEGLRMQEGMDLVYTVAEMQEKPRRGRKRKEGGQSGDADWSIE